MNEPLDHEMIAAEWLDMDQDGDLDLVPHTFPRSGGQAIVFENRGDGQVVTAAPFANVGSGHVADGRAIQTTLDCNSDGLPDLLTLGFSQSGLQPVQVLINRGAFEFSEGQLLCFASTGDGSGNYGSGSLSTWPEVGVRSHPASAYLPALTLALLCIRAW